jgi:O-methyltransferase
VLGALTFEKGKRTTLVTLASTLRRLLLATPITAPLVPPLQRARFRGQVSAIYARHRADTMVERCQFIDNLALAARVASVEGVVVECGVWRGGMIAGIAEVLGPSRLYYLLDSFEGLPPADAVKDGQRAVAYQADRASPAYHENCRADMVFAQRSMQLAGATRYELRKGWFADTLPMFKPAEPIVLLRLDVDWYESTLQCLTALYPLVRPGGLIILDDYHYWDGCTRAVHDYLAHYGLPERIRESPHGVAYLVKHRSARG